MQSLLCLRGERKGGPGGGKGGGRRREDEEEAAIDIFFDADADAEECFFVRLFRRNLDLDEEKQKKQNQLGFEGGGTKKQQQRIFS